MFCIDNSNCCKILIDPRISHVGTLCAFLFNSDLTKMMYNIAKVANLLMNYIKKNTFNNIKHQSILWKCDIKMQFVRRIFCHLFLSWVFANMSSNTVTTRVVSFTLDNLQMYLSTKFTACQLIWHMRKTNLEIVKLFIKIF